MYLVLLRTNAGQKMVNAGMHQQVTSLENMGMVTLQYVFIDLVSIDLK